MLFYNNAPCSPTSTLHTPPQQLSPTRTLPHEDAPPACLFVLCDQDILGRIYLVPNIITIRIDSKGDLQTNNKCVGLIILVDIISIIQRGSIVERGGIINRGDNTIDWGSNIDWNGKVEMVALSRWVALSSGGISSR
jgi:hypothetical protein